MDIAVFVPEKNHDLKSEEIIPLDKWHIILSTVKKLKEGDRVYFFQDHHLRASAKVAKIETVYMDDESSLMRKINAVKETILHLEDFKKETSDVYVRGFQSFRYRWWDKELQPYVKKT